MGELENWPVHQNGGDLSEFNMPTSPFRRNSSPNPQFEEIRGESWHVAERATEGVVQTIQATVVSEKRRQEVVEFVQRLIRGTLGCEVFPFGSVPLKTYLPDGDIDLTAFGMPNSEDSLSTSVLHVLQTEEHNNDSEFELKDVQFINAEVKLVKCLVQNIVVDISFNQSGGLSTLCFLERVDLMIGKDHLFKRSIILIKSWCYYESRILGAHHGLISTYALETLILYIFHLFHSSLDGPLAVLYRFLDYYSKFDWENFIVSLYGPIAVSSLPELVAETPENEGVDLLFTKEFLQSCVENFWVVPRAFESNFPQKHLNIVDPLRDYNNLGRSVNRGNFYRIRSAFSYGARKLGQLLVLPTESIAAQAKTFFANTLDRHGSGERPDVQGLSMYRIDRHSPPSESYASDATGELCVEMNDVKLNCFEDTISNVREKSKAPDFASGKTSSQNGKASHTPHLFFHSENGYQNGEHSESKRLPFNEEASVYCESESSTSSTSWFSTYGTSEQLEHSHPGESSSTRPEGNGTSGNTKRKKMADLTADYEMHLRNLLYVRWSQEYLLGTLLPFHPQPLPSYEYHNNKHSWDSPRRHGLYSQMNTTALVPGIPFSPSGSGYPTPFASSGGYGMEDPPKPRGTGTYFPNTNSRSYRERYSPRRGKYSFSGNHFSRHHNNSRPRTPQDADLPERSFSEPLPQLQLPVFSESGRWESAVVDTPHSPHPFLETTSPSSGFVVAHDGKLEFGSFGPVALGSSSADVGNSSNSGTPSTQGPTLTFLAATVQRPSMNPNCEGSSQAYQLKDEEDFPPLAG